jgi:hypothetical protein
MFVTIMDEFDEKNYRMEGRCVILGISELLEGLDFVNGACSLTLAFANMEVKLRDLTERRENSQITD